MNKHFFKYLFTFFIFLTIINVVVHAQTFGSDTTNSCPKVFTITGTSSSTTINQVTVAELLKNSQTLSTSGGKVDYNNLDDKAPLKGLGADGNSYDLYINYDLTTKTGSGVIRPNEKGANLDTKAGWTLLTRSFMLSYFGAYALTNLACPAKITDLQVLFLRIMVGLNTLVGLVLLFVIARAGIMRMISRGDVEMVKKSMKMLTMSIIGFMIVLMAYLFIVFLGTTLLPENSCYKYSFTDSGKILFLFDQSTVSPVVAYTQSPDNPDCPAIDSSL